MEEKQSIIMKITIPTLKIIQIGKIMVMEEMQIVAIITLVVVIVT